VVYLSVSSPSVGEDKGEGISFVTLGEMEKTVLKDATGLA
jgi:hypothetical protein